MTCQRSLITRFVCGSLPCSAAESAAWVHGKMQFKIDDPAQSLDLEVCVAIALYLHFIEYTCIISRRTFMCIFVALSGHVTYISIALVA